MLFIIRLFHTLVWRIFALALFLFLFCIDFFFFRYNPSANRFLEKTWSSIVLAVAGIKVKVFGLENVPIGTKVFMPNHQSDLDWPVLLAVLPGEYIFLAKKELFEVPVFGLHMKFAGHVPIDRSSAITTRRALRSVMETLMRGRSVVIFPEGTRSPDGRLGEFSQIVFTVIRETNLPVVPIVIDGTFKVLRKGNPIISPACVRVKILKPINFDEFREVNHTKEFCRLAAEKVREAIAKELAG